MSLTRDNWVKIVVGLGAVVLSVVLNIGVREWYQPDVRYATGGAYIHPKLAIASVGLKNYGGSDAENVTLTASFIDPYTDFNTDQKATPFEPSAGGTDKKSVTGTIKRLAPGEIINVYFITEPSSPWVDQKPVIRRIKFNGGLGKTGTPILTFWVPALLIFGASLGILAIPVYYLARWQQRTYDNSIREAIQRGHSAAQEGASEEQLRERVEEWCNTMPFHKTLRALHKETLMTCALTAFTVVNQRTTPTAGPMS